MCVWLRVWEIIQVTLTIPLWVTVYCHDAIISSARTYTMKQLLDMGETAQKVAEKRGEGKALETYSWEAWRQPAELTWPLGYLLPLYFFIGRPKRGIAVL